MILYKKPWYKRLVCLHLVWEELYPYLGWPDPQSMYQCQQCGKEKLFREQPVNYVGKL